MGLQASAVIGVDAGGTSCRSALVGLDGTVIAVGRSGAANPISSGLDRAVSAIADSISAALGDFPPRAVGAVVLATAGGANRPEVLDRLRDLLASSGVTAPVELVADGLAAYWSGTTAQDGCALVAGTGAVALRIESGEVVRAADGLGWLLGDGGSGFWMGRRIVRAVLAELDGRGPSTTLTAALLEAQQVTGPPSGVTSHGRSVLVQDLLTLLYGEPPITLARFARLALTEAADPVARGILADAARELAATLGAVLVPGQLGPVVLGGGLLAARPELRELLVPELGDALAGRELIVVDDGLAGAAAIALRRAGVTVDDCVFAALRAGRRG